MTDKINFTQVLPEYRASRTFSIVDVPPRQYLMVDGSGVGRVARDVSACPPVRPSGTHHEIYLSDPRRVAPEKLRTILRQPVLPL